MCKACSDFWYECAECTPVKRRGCEKPRLFFMGDCPCDHKVFYRPTIDILYLARIADFEFEEWFTNE